MKRWEIINNLIASRGYLSYLEIGCGENECFDKIVCTSTTGVDPLRGGTVRATSDAFFATNTKTFDIVFIDGLHHKQQVMSDITNSLNFLTTGGVILLHDALPSTFASQIVPLSAARKHPDFNGGWCGDVWKAVAHTRTLSNVDTCTTQGGGGIAFVMKRTNTSIVEDSQLIYDWDHYVSNKNTLMNVKSLRDSLLWCFPS